MRDLYARLKGLGFDRPFVQGAFLPDWWEDSLAASPANRALAEIEIARGTGIAVSDLRNPTTDLQPAVPAPVRLKRPRRDSTKDVTVPVVVAQSAARFVLKALQVPPRAAVGWTPEAVRQAILAKRGNIGLGDLVDFCWESGIVVLHISNLPATSPHLDGIAMFCEDRPVIVLGSQRDGWAWIAFHLAHELGHLVNRHVAPGKAPLADLDIGTGVPDDPQEAEADRAALRVLTGMENPYLPLQHGMTGARLGRWARQLGRECRVDPGVVALIYGKCTGRWPVAQLALKELQQSTGAHSVVRNALAARLNAQALPESALRFLEYTGVL